MIPQYHNPHAMRQRERIISRSQLLRRDSDANEVSDSSQPELIDSDETLAKLRALFDRDFDLPPLKRKKTEHTSSLTDNVEPSVSELTPFRLVSSIVPPSLVSIDPRPLPVYKAIEREYEDTAAEAERRERLALAAAVELDDIIRDVSRWQPVSKRTVRALCIKGPMHSLPHMIITEVATLPISKQRPPPLKGPGGVLCCPLVPLEEEAINTHRKRTRNGSRRKKT